MKNRKKQKLKTSGRDKIVKNGNVLTTDEKGRIVIDEDAMAAHGSLVNPHDG